MKNLYYFLTSSIFCFIIISGSINASVPKGISLIKVSDGYTINFVLPAYEFKIESAENEQYYRVELPSYGVISEVGLPALPQLSFNMFIAFQEGNPVVNVRQINSEVKELKHKIYPFQQPWEKNNPISERPFTIDHNYYNSGGKVYPPIEISEPFIINGVKGIIVTIHPFNYSPVENKLIVINSGEFKLSLSNYVTPVSGKSRTFNNFFKNIFVNYEYSTEMSGGNYLVITAPAYEADLTPFVNFKTSSGFAVDVFNTNTTGTTTTAIKAFIQQRYNNLATRPDYILLVGDVANIPAWTGSGAGSPTTDLNYVQLEGGDYFADAFIGRYSVANSTQLGNAINKSIFMESYVGSLDKKNVFMASNDNYTVSEGTHNYVINTYFDPAGYTNLKLYCHTYSATTQQLINALNDNQIFAIYSGHGSETSWADGPPLNQSQVNALTNTWYPYVYSFACVTGSYHISECFGETWLRTENGASTFYGSSVNSYWDEDDILEKNVIKAMFEDELTRVTPMFVQGMIYLVNYYGGINGTTLRYMEMYNLMGDPSLPVVETLPPCPVEEATNPTPANGATGISISLSEISWTNGAGTMFNEVYFGEVGSLSLVYDGTPITSWAIPGPLSYYTTYGWRVVCKNDTCGVSGPTWTFTTQQDPNLVHAFYEPFNNMTCWTEIGPLGMGNWSISTSTNAGGSPPTELELYWSPSFVGLSQILSCPINSSNLFENIVTWEQYLSFFAAPGPDIGLAVTYDGGLTSTPLWQITTTGDIPAEERCITFTPTSDTYQLIFFLNGDIYNINWWDIDDVTIDYLVPVEVTSFTASPLHDEVELKWTTATETNNRGFEIERMSTGGQFEKIGFVAGYGTTTEPKAYSFVDTKLETGRYTYRLKQIDLDGTYKYSKEVDVDVEFPIEYALEQNYPNPFNPSTTIKYSILEDGFVKLAVYNMLGEEIISLVNNVQKAGRYEVTFDASSLASGVYLYRLEAQKFISIKKMILIK